MVRRLRLRASWTQVRTWAKASSIWGWPVSSAVFCMPMANMLFSMARAPVGVGDGLGEEALEFGGGGQGFEDDAGVVVVGRLLVGGQDEDFGRRVETTL